MERDGDRVATVHNQRTDSLAHALVRRVLTKARSVDSNVKLSSISEIDETSNTLMRLRTSVEGDDSSRNATAKRLAEVLRCAWPLATVGVVENVLDGGLETTILLERATVSAERAREIARDGARARRLATLALALLGATVFSTAYALAFAS